MELILESSINVSTSLALEGSSNMQLTSNTEDEHLSNKTMIRSISKFKLKLMQKKKRMEKTDNVEVLGCLLKTFWVVHQLFYPEFQLKMQANR